MEEGKGVNEMKAHVEYIRLPKKYNSANWGMDMISFRIPPELNTKLERIAQKKKITKSELIRMAIAKYLQEAEEND